MEIKEYFKVMWKRWWMIAIIVVLATAAAGVYSIVLQSPIYQASTKIVVNKTYVYNGMEQLSQSDVQANVMLTNTYKEIIRSERIMDKVVEKYPHLNVTSDQLVSMVGVSVPTDSQVMNVFVQDYSYVDAARIVNAISHVFVEEVPSIMSVDNVTLLNEAKENVKPAPVAPNTKLNIMVAFMLSLMLGVGLAFFLEYLDDTLKTEADIEHYLELPTLSVISHMKKYDLHSKRKTNMTNNQVGEAHVAAASK